MNIFDAIYCIQFRITSNQVAKSICSSGDWKVTNLVLQKVLYLVYMIYYGEHDAPLFCDASFEAWNCGPVIPKAHNRVKVYGKSNIQKQIFADVTEAPDLRIVWDFLLKLKPYQLVEITHDKNSAWTHLYSTHENVIISNKKIKAECIRRFSTNKKSSQT